MQVSSPNEAHSKVTSFFTGSNAALEDEAVVLKDYATGQRLGEGAYGSVYSVKHIPSGETFALKILQKQDLFLNTGDDTMVNMDAATPLGGTQYDAVARTYAEAFERKIVQEATVMQALQHPHVVNFYRFLNSNEAYYFIMELAEGGELFDLIISSHYFEEDEARFYFQQLMSAIEYCHRNGVAHSDLKAENLLLGKDNRLLVCDFGFSSKNVKESADDPEATLGTGDNVALVESLVNGFSGVGTLHYMSPEAIRATTERAAPDVLLNLGFTGSLSASPNDGDSLSSPGQQFDYTESFPNSFNRQETGSFPTSTVRTSHTTTTAPSTSSRVNQPVTGMVSSGSPTAGPKTHAVPAASPLQKNRDFPILSSPTKPLKTSYSTADLDSVSHEHGLRRPPRLEKTGRHSSHYTLASTGRSHTSMYGETISSPKSMSDRWSSFMKSLKGHHERGDSACDPDAVRRGMRKSRSTGSLSVDETSLSACPHHGDRKKCEHESKKKKKKPELTKPGSLSNCPSCESFTHETGEAPKSDASHRTNTPLEAASPSRPPRVVVDPYQQDLWSAGVILFFMLTGRLPFDGRDDEETLHLIELDEATFEEEEQDRISPEARALVIAMLAKEPTDRPDIDGILLNKWFVHNLDVDDLFEDRKDELKAKIAKAGLTGEVQNGHAPQSFRAAGACGGVDEQVIQTAFTKIDTDGYGNITRDELRDMMTTLHGDHVEKKDVSELIGLFTGDGTSDAISYQQFRDAWVNRDLAHSAFAHNSEFQLANIVGVQMDDVERQLVRQLRSAFDSVNDDHGGFISTAQLRRVFERFDCATTDSDVESLIAYFDNRPTFTTRALTNPSFESSSANPSFIATMSPTTAPMSPCVTHEKGITFDAFVQGIVHKDILLRHPLGRRLAAATNLAALFQSHNVTECVRHGFLVSGLQNVILQKLTTVPERLLLLYTDETVSTTENIYSFRYLGSTALVQGATIENVGPALASSTALAMSTSMPLFGASHTTMPSGSVARLSHSRRATTIMSSSAQNRMMAYPTNGASLNTPVPSVGDFLSRSGRAKRAGSCASEGPMTSPDSLSGLPSSVWPPPGTLNIKTASPTSPYPGGGGGSTDAASTASQGVLAPAALHNAQTPAAQSAHAASHLHHHRAHYQHHPHGHKNGHSASASPHLFNGTASSGSVSLREYSLQASCEDKHVSSAAPHCTPSELSSDDGESQISVGRNSDSIVGTTESGEVSPARLSSCTSLGHIAEEVSTASVSRGATPSAPMRSPTDCAPPRPATTTTAKSTSKPSSPAPTAAVPAPPVGRKKNGTPAPKGKPPMPSPSSAARYRDGDGTAAKTSAVAAPRLPAPKSVTEVPAAAEAQQGMGHIPSYGDNLFTHEGSPQGGSAASAQDFLSRSTGFSASSRAQTGRDSGNFSVNFPHRSLAFGASGAVPQVNGVCDVDIILAPAFLGYTLVRFRRIHGKTNDFHEAVIYVSNLLDVERQQASEDTLPRGESELM